MAEIPPGNIVGEMSLLSHGQRTRSVAALRDSEVWRLARVSFDKLTARHPEVLPTLMRSVAVRNAMGPTKRRRQPRTFAILPTGSTPAARFAFLLAAALGRIGSQVQMLGPQSRDRDPEWFARAETEASFVLYRADPTATEWTELCLRQADCLVVVRAADDELPTRLPLRWKRRSRAPSSIAAASWWCCTKATIPSRARRRDAGRRSLRPASSRAARRPRRCRPAGAPADRARRRRRHGGRRGARLHPYRRHQGAARFRRADRPGWRHQHGRHRGGEVASRWPDDEITRHFRAAFVDNNPLSDYTLPLISLYAGRRVTRLLRTSFGEKEIEDLILPFFCVTANLTTSNADVHYGRPTVALAARLGGDPRACIPPFNEAGEVHVDGGVIDNFPVRTMRRHGTRRAAVGVDIDTGGALAAGAGVYGAVVGVAVLPPPDLEARTRPCRSPRSSPSCSAPRWSPARHAPLRIAQAADLLIVKRADHV